MYPSITEWKSPSAKPALARSLIRKPAPSPPFRYNEEASPLAAPMLSQVRRASSKAQAQESNDHAFSTRASWYGPGFSGRRTASGARFNEYGMTAASRTLPLGSKVLVANPTSGRCCTVTINDRGPYVSGRDIDLSEGAARRVGITGVSPVICVAYANQYESVPSSPRYSRRGSSRYRHSSSNKPARISGRVMHLIAGVI
jgi:rare lipoprotein A